MEDKVRLTSSKLTLIVKADLSKAMKESMATYEQEQIPAESEFMNHLLKQSQNEYQLQQQKLLQDIQLQSKQQYSNPHGLPPIKQVANMGFPMELVLKAYQNVGDDVPKMIDYIYKELG